MARSTIRVLWAAVAALSIAGAAGAVVVDPDDEPSTPRPRPSASTSTTPATAVPAEALAAVRVLTTYVEEERGLRFEEPVEVQVLGADEFDARLEETAEEDLADLREVGMVLQAVGLLDAGADLADVADEFSAGVLGFYDLRTEELVVRGDRFTPLVRTVVVHELTHALEHQHFDLYRPELGDEAFLGFQALAEGSATTVEEAFRREVLTAGERADADRELERVLGPAGSLPEALEELFNFPYFYGPDLVAAVVRSGRGRLDATFADPPASTEQVLDPRRYLRGDDPRPVPRPAADGRVFDDGEIGQLFLFLMLDEEVSQRDATEAAVGWGGDHYVAWRDGDRTCVRMDFVMDTPADTAELTATLSRWATARGAGKATAAGTSARSCT